MGKGEGELDATNPVESSSRILEGLKGNGQRRRSPGVSKRFSIPGYLNKP